MVSVTNKRYAFVFGGDDDEGEDDGGADGGDDGDDYGGGDDAGIHAEPSVGRRGA